MIARYHVYKPYVIIFFLVTLIDRITKSIMLQLSEPYQVNNWLSFSLQFNRGIATGLFDSQHSGIYLGLTILIMLFILGFTIYTWIRWLNYESVYPEVLVLSGALSNLVDRIFYPGVIDFIVVTFGEWTFPVFNIADAVIVTGVFFMVLSTYAKK